MNKNDIIRLTIEDMSFEGAGIGHTEGVTIFVKDAVVGDVVDVIITKVKKTYCFATVKEVITPGQYRVTPPCSIARTCGGCQIMQVDYTKQLEIKQSIVENNLVKIGGFDRAFVKSVMEPIIGMENPYRYRNKAQIPIGKNKDGQIVAGFYGARSHRIVPTDDCKICSKSSMDIAKAVIRYMEENKVDAYDEDSCNGLIRHVLVREGRATGEVMVCIVANGSKLPNTHHLIAQIMGAEPKVKSIVLNINRRTDNVILGDETKLIYGKEAISDSITIMGRRITFEISANSFYQVNHDQMEKLYTRALEYAGLTGKENVWDLYCGIGTISLSMASHAGKVYGVEVVPQAIENAKNNALRNGFTNTEFFCGEAEVVLPEFYRKGDSQMNHPDVIMVDPPRKGCDEKCLKTMVVMQPDRIVYVSCDSATLARDLQYICENGYKLEKVTAVDQFGHTMHVETVVLLSRKTC